MERDPIPLDETGNGVRLRTLTFDETDAFMLAHAMMIASNTAMMGGAPDGLRRLNHYRDQFLAVAPPEASMFRRDTDLCEIAIAMSDAPVCTVRRLLKRWSKDGRSEVAIGKRRWTTSDSLPVEAHDGLVAMLRRVAPMGCAIEMGEDGESEW